MAKARGKTDLEAELRELHHGPLGEFTAARNALAKQLDKSGDKDAAAEVKSLPKPSVSAWAVNRLFEREPEKMRELLEAGEHARAGLRHAISGKGVESLRDALDNERALRDALRRRAAALIEEDTGRKASAAILDRVATNLDSLALSPDSAEAADRGWISVDLAPPGFEVLSGMPLTGARTRPGHLRLVPPSRDRKEEKREEPRKAAPAKAPEKDTGPTLREQRDQARAETARRREEEAESRKREREEELRRERLARLEEKAAEIRADADAAKREAARADKAVEDAEKALEEARRRLETARDDARRSHQRADRAAERLARAEKDLER
jgi:hypothetical protein